jgi:hypothetical protein
MRAILIDTIARELREIDIAPGDLVDVYREIGEGCELVTVAHYYDDGVHSIYVDDEGLLMPKTAGFFVRGGHQPFAGNGVVTAINDEGETVDCTMTIEEVRDGLSWTGQIVLR